jgi:hypothetical protein
MEQSCPTIRHPKFDEKYKIIIKLNYSPEFHYLETLDWIDRNSKDSVDVAVVGEGAGPISIYYAFENSDDALIFKIKYST